MARYIDADKLIEALQVDFDREGANAYEMAIKGIADASVKYSHGQFCYLNAIERVKDTPTADVVPKSEVEQLERNLGQCENGYRQEMHLLQCKLTNAKGELAREIFVEIKKSIGAKYNHYVFGNNDLDDIERDAIINFCDSILNGLDEIENKYVEGEESGVR